MEDLDTLLDEAELVASGRTSARHFDLKVTKRAQSQEYSLDSQDTDSDIIEEIDLVLKNHALTPSKINNGHLEDRVPRPEGEDANKSTKKKCSPVYLGGAYSGLGISTHMSERSCNTLLCLKCDLKVVHFDNCVWGTGASYIFLRTNFPDRHKLAKMLEKQTGTRSYCCQCSCVSVQEYTLVQEKAPDWICTKH